MYTEQNKGFTVITNFGCKEKCKYCISKHHPVLQNKITRYENIVWSFLDYCIEHTESPKVNVSGGGDPFYEYEKHMSFFYKLKQLCDMHGKLLDSHTRIIPTKPEFINMFNKLAISVEYWDFHKLQSLAFNFNKLTRNTKLRIIQVVDGKCDVEELSTYIESLKSIGIEQITFRQMFGNKKAFANFEKLKDTPELNGEGILWLKDGEYHDYYFTTENKMYPYFFGNSEEDRNTWKKKYEDIEQNCA